MRRDSKRNSKRPGSIHYYPLKSMANKKKNINDVYMRHRFIGKNFKFITILAFVTFLIFGLCFVYYPPPTLWGRVLCIPVLMLPMGVIISIAIYCFGAEPVKDGFGIVEKMMKKFIPQEGNAEES